ncbi:DUF4825 domain-containing protein [Bacillus safensis]|uniref:DUF4825 domain-containing protein n=1 Tax=Bacillus safensis TaxID=561879 RepID=UPI000F8689B8|nr:DUF4825 domain-containing protein [Bacillus safensis]MBU5207918.1 DUF4825 domain-containing protein [Bacillus safensis]MCK1974722.1 DUF4825 domain-containing protein [Bacillus safensis]RUK42721.1 DUF4825 domain-containing protein [Bacillus safensis]
MKKWMYVLLLLTVVLSSCSSQATEKKSDIKGIEDIALKQLSNHKNTYLGDNSAVRTILSDLPGGIIREFEIIDGKALNVTYGVKENDSYTEEQFDAFWFDQKDTVEKTYLYNAIALFILIDNVEQVTLKMNSNDEPSVTFKRKQLEKKLPHSFKKYKDDTALWQKELVDGIVKSKEKRQDVYKAFPMQK